MPLILTLICGMFFLVGIIGYKFSKHQTELTIMAIACAAVVMLGLMCFDLIPELLALKKWYLIIFTFIGLGMIFVLDSLIPHHTHHHHEHDEHTKAHIEHINHISIVTMLALLCHNGVEGLALYNVAINDLKSGILMALGISLHNLPFGFQIASFDQKRNKGLLGLLILSSFIGGLIGYFVGDINIYVEGIIIAITLGMIFHIFFGEMIKEVINNIKKKETFYGIIIGVLLLIIINVI